MIKRTIACINAIVLLMWEYIGYLLTGRLFTVFGI
jgi:hypothetical protein